MKNKVYWVICICPLWLFLSNCVDKFNAHLPESSIGLLIVEGSIISDSAVVFSLSRSFSLDVEGVPPDFNKVDAEVCVTGEDGSSFRGVALGNGKYRVAVGTLHRDVRYSLKIVYEGDIYTSEPQYPIGTESIDDVTYEQQGEYGDVSIVSLCKAKMLHVILGVMKKIGRLEQYTILCVLMIPIQTRLLIMMPDHTHADGVTVNRPR